MTEFPKTIKELQKALGFQDYDYDEFRELVFELIEQGHVVYDNGYCLTREGLQKVKEDNGR